MAKHSIRTPTAGSVWTHSVGVGQHVVEGTDLLIVEVMKTEWPIKTEVDGEVTWLKPCGETLEVDDLVAIVDDQK
jgi:biotin carboxyl carrier protein